MIICDMKVLLNVVIYDLEFMVGLLMLMIVVSVLNVMVYFMEGFYVWDCNLIFIMMVVEFFCSFKVFLLGLIVELYNFDLCVEV